MLAATQGYECWSLYNQRCCEFDQNIADVFMLLEVGCLACISSDCAESHSFRRFQVKSACKEASATMMLVWPSAVPSQAGTMGNGEGLCSQMKKTWMAKVYINEVLMPHVLPFLRRMPVANPIFKDDNPRPHRGYCWWLPAHNVKRMVWPANSPDLLCIEHAWDILGELFRNVWSKTAHCKIFSSFWEKIGSSNYPETRLLIQEQSPWMPA